MTAAEFSGLPLPSAETNSGPEPRRRPRNFLSLREHRRLFWAFMPPAVIVLVALELLTRSDRPSGPPPQPQVDTRLEAVAGPPPAADEVVILPTDEPSPTAAPEELAASREALGKVRDAAFFGRADHEAWLESFLTLRGDGDRLAPAREVGFTELFGQPKSFRGRPVKMRGTLRRLERLRAPKNDRGIEEYWQGWLEPAGGPPSPVIVHFLELPAGMASGMKIHEPVVIDGCFLKNMAYRAADDVRVAPLLLARAPALPPRPPAAAEAGWWERSLPVIGVATMLLFVGTIATGFFLGSRGRKVPPPAADLDDVLAGFDPVSIEKSLQRVAADEAAGGGGAASQGS